MNKRTEYLACLLWVGGIVCALSEIGWQWLLPKERSSFLERRYLVPGKRAAAVPTNDLGNAALAGGLIATAGFWLAGLALGVRARATPLGKAAMAANGVFVAMFLILLCLCGFLELIHQVVQG